MGRRTASPPAPEAGSEPLTRQQWPGVPPGHLKPPSAHLILCAMRDADYMPILELALREDLGDLGDVTSQAVVPDGERSAALWSKGEGVLAGEEVFAAVFRALDPGVRVEFLLHDGEELARGARVATVAGRALSLLSAERTAINFIAFLSGIATATRELVDIARASGKAVILDTRKTLPGWRALSKYAVRVGGGENHRQGLYDMVLIKDNHVDSAGSVAAAVAKVRERWGGRFRIEVECRSTAEVDEALAAGSISSCWTTWMRGGCGKRCAASAAGRAWRHRAT